MTPKYRKLNKAVKTKWVKALNSGNYKQTRGYLHNVKSGGFCCLGVLCDLHSKSSSKTAEEWRRGTYAQASYSLPSVVAQWAKLDDKAADKLISLNDSFKRNFKTIAKWIKEHL